MVGHPASLSVLARQTLSSRGARATWQVASAAVYNSLAEDEQDPDAKAALLAAASKEIENAEVLEAQA